MQILIKNDVLVERWRNFIDSFLVNPNSNETLYIGLGYLENIDSNSFQFFDVADERNIRDNVSLMKRVYRNDMVLVVPRNDWEVGKTFNKYQNTLEALEAGNFYCLAEDDYGIYNVYKCIENTSDSNDSNYDFDSNGILIANDKPESNILSIITTSDGYSWRFMYDLEQSDIDKFLTESYMPVPHGIYRSQGQQDVEAVAAYTENENAPIGGHGSSAIYELNAKRAEVYVKFNFEEFTPFPSDFKYNYLVVWTNPKTFNNEQLLSQNVVVYEEDSNDVVTTTINTSSGRILYVYEFDEVFVRDTNDFRTFRLFLS